MISTRSSDPLQYAARPRVVGKYLGQLAIVLAVLDLVPLGVALGFGDVAMAWRFGAVAAVLLGAGVPLARMRVATPIQANEALTVSALAILLAAVATAFPLAAHGPHALDAWFEAVSAVTTTGLSTYASADALPRSFLFARAWAQWYGGFGIVVLSVALLVGHGVSARRLVDAGGEELVTVTRLYARRMLAVYLALSAAVLVLFGLAGLGPFDAVAHMLAAVSTGGFATHDASLAALGAPAEAAVSAASLAGAIALPAYYRLYRGGWRSVAADEELRVLLAVTLAVCAALFLARFGLRWPGARAMLQTAAMGVSAQTTTGFSTTEVVRMGPAAMVILMLAMASGGMVGSTAGGVKLLRVLMLFRLLGLLMRRLAMPMHAVATLRLDGERVESEEIERGMLLVFLFGLTVLLSWIPFLAAGYDPLASLFEIVSATGTVGLSAGVTGATLAPALKLVLCADMLLGRLEFVALLVVLYWPTWIGRRSDST